MPLLVMVGKPSSGKTTIAARLKDFFEAKQIPCTVISDDVIPTFSKDIYSSSYLERQHREMIRSEVRRALASNAVIVCDSLNYVKGFRYELMCAAKELQKNYAFVYCDADEDARKWLNVERDTLERYKPDQIYELDARFESPDPNAHDYPLFTVKVGLEDQAPRLVGLPYGKIYTCLYEDGIPAANRSTKSNPPKPAEFLRHLDHITRAVMTAILKQQLSASTDDTFTIIVEGKEYQIDFVRPRTMSELCRLRNQFLTFLKTHPVENSSSVAELFVNYLNANF